MQLIAKEVTTNLVRSITWGEDEAMAMLGLSPPLDPQVLQDRTEECLKEIVSGKDFSQHSKTPVESLSLLWCHVLRSLENWEWIRIEVHLNNEYDHTTIGLCDSKRRYLMLPRELFQKFVQDKNVVVPRQIVSFIRAGQLPPTKNGELLNLGERLRKPKPTS